MSVAAPGLVTDLDVLAFAQKALQSGQRAALATIVGLDGPFSRPLGAQLAILDNGSFVGSISGGCLETALCEEARDAIANGVNKLLRYGQGSPFLDVRLPCGGGLDILVDTHLEAAVLDQALDAGRSRRDFALSIDIGSAQQAMRMADTERSGSAKTFIRKYQPVIRTVLAGRGWEIVALSQLAHEAGYEVSVLSQEAATLEYCRPFANKLIALNTPQRVPEFSLDRHSAFVSLFHEHEWEIALLEHALASSAFYVGALGSRQTSAVRMEQLVERGAGKDQLERLRGPIGLFHAQAPRALAVSTLAQIMSEYRG